MKPLDSDDPREIGGYRILRVLGAGGMGRVYVGRSRGGRVVAVKVVRPELSDDPGFQARFRHEVEAARRVSGPWTAPLLDADPDAEHPWLVTGYVPGPSLHEAVTQFGPLPEESVRILAAGLAEALAGIHAAGVVHRDLKPSNVILSLDGPCVIDFGISRALDASAVTRTGYTVGSPGFMAPEQVNGDAITPATDLFSLGTVLTFAATGHGAFGEGNAQALLYRILTMEPELGGVPESLRPIVEQCLDKNPAGRPSPQDVLAAVRTVDATAGSPQDAWLPGVLMAQLSRRAVELLELDDSPQEFAPAPTTQASAPAHFPTPAYTTPYEPGAKRPWWRSPWPYVGVVVAGGAAALIAVLLSGGGGKGPAASTTTPPAATSATTPPTASDSPSPSVSSLAQLPGQYVGTWTGTTTTSDGLLTTSITVSITAGKPGDTLAQSSVRDDSLGVTCSGSARLVSVTASGGAVFADIPSTVANPLCVSDGGWTMTPAPGGAMAYSASGTGSGTPTGTLHKS